MNALLWAEKVLLNVRKKVIDETTVQVNSLLKVLRFAVLSRSRSVEVLL